MQLNKPTLNPDIWDLPTKKLKPDVRNRLLRIAIDFYKKSKLTAPIHDVYFLGSNASYNYTRFSDLDVHVVINFKNLSDDVVLVKTATDALKQNWNKDHSIKIKNKNVEVYIQDIAETNRSQGVYSLVRNQWIKVPQKLNVKVEAKKVKQLYSHFTKMISAAIRSKDLNQIDQLIKQICDMREAGLSRDGEFSHENIAFKALRNHNWLDKLKTTSIDTYDKKLSLKEKLNQEQIF